MPSPFVSVSANQPKKPKTRKLREVTIVPAANGVTISASYESGKPNEMFRRPETAVFTSAATAAEQLGELLKGCFSAPNGMGEESYESPAMQATEADYGEEDE